MLAPTQSERNALLRGYFEPTEQEAAEGIKMPKAAHQAIARLMAAGYVRVVITTNFDRLLERAADAAGLTPTVISTADAVAGAVPLIHSKVVIIKVNGDYLDTRIRNTVDELSQYEPPITAILDRVLDEFGLLVCGWSADWDVGLRAAIERAPNRRFTTFWCLRGVSSGITKSLITRRNASALNISGADSFFEELVENVFSLRDIPGDHPLSSALAIQSIKRYLPNPLEAIRLSDLVMQEVERVFTACGPSIFPFATQFSEEEFGRRIARYEATSEVLQSMFAVGCYWGRESHIPLWVRALQRLANPAGVGGGAYYEIFQRLSYYPSLLLLYAGGIAAIAAKKYKTFAALACHPIVRRPFRGQEGPLVTVVNAASLLPKRDAQNFNAGQNLKTPTSEHLFAAVRPRLSELLPDDHDFQRAFDEFEYLACLTVMHRTATEAGVTSVPIGSFAWRDVFNDNRRIEQLSKEADALGNQWPPLKAGLFDGSLGVFRDVRNALHSSEVFKELAF
jgi:hypothetical protein